MTTFSYRAGRPVYDTGAFTVAGKETDDGADLWIADVAGALAMSGKAEFAPI